MRRVAKEVKDSIISERVGGLEGDFCFIATELIEFSVWLCPVAGY